MVRCPQCTWLGPRLLSCPSLSSGHPAGPARWAAPPNFLLMPCLSLWKQSLSLFPFLFHSCLGLDFCVPCVSTTHRLITVSPAALPRRGSFPLTPAPSFFLLLFKVICVCTQQPSSGVGWSLGRGNVPELQKAQGF